MRLTKAVVERAWKARGAARQTLRDEQVRGLALVVNATSASWQLEYRPRGTDDQGRRWPNRHLRLGTLDVLDLDGARMAAGAAKAKVQAGGDPSREQAADIAAKVERRRKALTVAEAAAAVLAWMAATPSAKTGRVRSAGYLADAKRYMDSIADVLDQGALLDVARWRALETWLEELPASQRVQAKAVARALVGRMVKLGHLSLDPLAGRWPSARTAQRDRTPSPAEIAAILRAADTLALPAKGRKPLAERGGKASIEPVWRDLLHVIALTGCRRSEAAGMRVEHVDLAARVWKQPSATNKARREHVVPLGEQAAEIVARAIGKRTVGLVFPGRVGGPVSGWSRMWSRVTAEAGIAGVSIHDLRRGLVSAVAETGAADVATLDRLLNHVAAATSGGVIAVYQRASMIEPMRRAVAAWESILAEHMGRQRGGNVVALKVTA